MSEAPRSGSGRDGRCPICGKPTVVDYRPFCSIRCADVDLSRWLRGAYAIPGREPAQADHPESDGRKDGEAKEDS